MIPVEIEENETESLPGHLPAENTGVSTRRFGRDDKLRGSPSLPLALRTDGEAKLVALAMAGYLASGCWREQWLGSRPQRHLFSAAAVG